MLVRLRKKEYEALQREMETLVDRVKVANLRLRFGSVRRVKAMDAEEFQQWTRAVRQDLDRMESLMARSSRLS